MAGRPPKAIDTEGLLADWQTGRYKGTTGLEKLAKKYGIGKTKVFELTRDVPLLTNELTNKLVEVNQELNQLTNKNYESVVNHANREAALKSRRDLIVNLAFDVIEERLQKGVRAELSPMDIKCLIDANDKNCVTAEIADRFNKNAGSTNIAQAGVGVSINQMDDKDAIAEAQRIAKRLVG
jgi:hypothetical protein